MTSFEIAITAIGSLATTAFATVGLQKWACSKSTQDEASSDGLKFTLNELTIEDGNKKITIKGLNYEINESDKTNLDQNKTDGQIGDKDVSIAALNLKPSLLPSAATPVISTNSPLHNFESHLPANGPSSTHEVQDTGQNLKDFGNAIIEFITKYTQTQIYPTPNTETTVPLLGDSDHTNSNSAEITDVV